MMFAPVVQRIERSVADAKVGGSSPSGCANIDLVAKNCYMLLKNR